MDEYKEALTTIIEDTSKAGKAIGVAMNGYGELVKMCLKDVVHQSSKFLAEIISFKNEVLEQKPVFIFGAVLGAVGGAVVGAAAFFIIHKATKKTETDRRNIEEENIKEENIKEERLYYSY